jgi:hypothetical protein
MIPPLSHQSKSVSTKTFHYNSPKDISRMNKTFTDNISITKESGRLHPGPHSIRGLQLHRCELPELRVTGARGRPLSSPGPGLQEPSMVDACSCSSMSTPGCLICLPVNKTRAGNQIRRPGGWSLF